MTQKAAPIKLIVGLGNPGKDYAKTRHNVGFLFIDELCRQAGVSLQTDKHCFGRSTKATLFEQTVRLLTPETFMNLSGKSVVAALSYYKVDLSETLVVHDDLDLDAGVARLKLGGGHGGNNGLRDIIAKTGRNDFARLRLGIGHPGKGRDVSGYVLKPAKSDEQKKIDDAMHSALRLMPEILVGDLQSAMNELHTAN